MKYLICTLVIFMAIVVRADDRSAVKIAYVWSDKPLANLHDRIRFSAFVESDSAAAADDIKIDLQCSDHLAVSEAHRQIPHLAAGGFQRIDWTLDANTTGSSKITATLTSGVHTSKSDEYRILVIDPTAHLSRQQLCTDENGFWHILEKPSTLQNGNKQPLTSIEHKTSSQIGHNMYGMCVQLPRSRDYEDPFSPASLIDDDPETSWSSQQQPSPYPGDAPWVKIDLGAIHTIAQINLIPHWSNGEFPVGFVIQSSRDGGTWQTVVHEENWHVNLKGPKRGNKIAQLFPLKSKVAGRFVRIEFDRLPPANGYYAEVVSGFKARLSGIEVIDEQGKNIALASAGATITASEYFTGWQNTYTEVAKAFDRIFELGIKLVRVGQWGDQTEWAAVEREKGKFAVDPVTDAAIHRLADNGVDILYGLEYGNALYQHPDKPYIDIGPIFHEGHPFYMNAGPRTEAGRAAFVRYVDFVVRKYKNQVKYWELWNEENGWYPGFEPVLYGKLLHDVAKHIKEIDPKAVVVFGGTAAPAPITTEIALQSGAAPYVDVYAFHPYGIDKPEGGMGTMEFQNGKNLSQTQQQTGWKTLQEIVAGVKKPFAQHGRPDIHVWLDEWGTNVTGLDYAYRPNIGEYACAKWMTRFYTFSGWLGLPTSWWALYTDNKSQDWGILDPKDFSFRPMAYALQNVCTLLSDVQPVQSLNIKFTGNAPEPKTIAFHTDVGNRLLVLAWSADKANDQVRAYHGQLSFPMPQRPESMTLTDVYWGLSQTAAWKYEDGRVVIDQLIIRDYPVMIACQ